MSNQGQEGMFIARSLQPSAADSNPPSPIANKSSINLQSQNPNHHPKTEGAKDRVSIMDRREEGLHPPAGLNPFTAEPGSALDPNGESFNARAWYMAMLQLHSEDKCAHPRRTLGIAFSNLNVYGFGSDTDYQKTVGNVCLEILGLVRNITGQHQRKIEILKNLEGLVEAGEMLVVLGPPGSGCSTFLKTISGETDGFHVDTSSSLNFQGVTAKQMSRNFRGEAIYTAELDVHFPKLTVGDTLFFAARARAPRHIPGGVSVNQYALHMRDAVMAGFGIRHTKNTIVGNESVRGVSGGERKRVSIAEACLSMAPLQCWDNSTRGLDSANAIEFCKTLRTQTEINGATACVAIYQAPQDAYNLFDKVLLLYEGRQIYFGRTDTAKKYFLDLGFTFPARQTDADFLTSMTSPLERVIQPGYERRVPHTPDEFAARWQASAERTHLLQEIEEYNAKFALGGEYLDQFKQSRRAQQAKIQHVSSPYTLSYIQQVSLCLWRAFQRLKADPSVTISSLFGNSVMALVIASMFYNLQANTNSFFQRGALIFFAVLMNAFGSGLEMLTLYAQRAIVEKHARYALYHPSAEAISSMLMDLPYKILNAITFNLILYFMTNLRREPGPFFFLIFTSFVLTLTMSMFFRSIASLTRSLVQALAPASILMLVLIMYTGFTLPTHYMLGWARWIAYINPISYGFESLMINEFHNRDFLCVDYVPSGTSYEGIGQDNHVCSTVGSVAGNPYVNGNDFVSSAYGYVDSHKWRNIGIIFVFMLVLMSVYLVSTEFITAKKSKGEILFFRRGHKALSKRAQNDVEGGNNNSRGVSVDKIQLDEAALIEHQNTFLHWKDVCYDIKIGKEQRKILDHVDGWIKPGTLTALMGVSGAGKTSLLNVLAARTTIGVVAGEILVNGKPREESFQQTTGYAQQEDLHLSTATVREALTFSALLRQPAHIPRQEKISYVTEVIKLLDMTEYADAIVGVQGEGLNVEQRKRLTIGVELVARPALLFLDEPTSGLDSQTSWIILDLLEKLRDSGQAILCTIHQPSAMLFQRFDRILLLEAGGRTVYFGDVGRHSRILIDYFVHNGGGACPPDANPAEWMLDVIGAAPGSHTDIDWHSTWLKSPEYARVQEYLAELKAKDLARTVSFFSDKTKHEHSKNDDSSSSSNKPSNYREFAAPFGTQLCEVLARVWQQIWRSPTYIYSKTVLCGSSALFIGFSLYKTANTIQGLQNQMFSIFMLFTMFGQLIQQIMPTFIAQRTVYEARERPSKVYSWKAFMIANITIELFWNSLMSVLVFVCWYYPVGLYRNADATDAVALRGLQMWLFIWTFLLFSSTFAHLLIASFDKGEAAGSMGNLLFMLCLLFCGVLATPSQFPGFWIFMYRVSPFTYLVSGMLAVGISRERVTCATNEFLHFDPLDGATCAQSMSAYESSVGGYVENALATSDCAFCPVSSTDVYLDTLSISYADVWRNFGLMWVYIVFNIFAACLLYWWVRVPRATAAKRGKKDKKTG